MKAYPKGFCMEFFLFRTRIVPLLLWGAALGWSATVAALSDDSSKPIQIAADGVEMDEAKGTSVYTGNVEVQQGSIRLWADQVTVHHQPDRKPQRFVAVGKPARYRQLMDNNKGEVKARALRMEYDANSEEINLYDDAHLSQGKDTFQSDRILYDRNKALVKAGASAKGKQRVNISIDPNKK